ncbi:MAG: nuclear transport factor 2 family protein [Candidatus Acidiferrales bacterium]|jgi:3-phenylpropionate/cinnamic acid dioxygenase small subunit
MAQLTEAEIRNAEQACAALAIEYAEIVDSEEYARFREIFAEDAAFTLPMNPQDTIRGVDNIIATFTSRPRTRLTQHIISNIRVRIETPETAAGTCRVLLFTADAAEPETAEGRKASPKQLLGTYYDRYVRTTDGWRFAERRGTITLHT